MFWAALLLLASAQPLDAQSTDTGTFSLRNRSSRRCGYEPRLQSRPGIWGFDFTATCDRASASTVGKGQQPFKAPLAGARYRLGNEAETYLETTFDYGVRPRTPDPAYFDTRLTLAFVAPTSAEQHLHDDVLTARGLRARSPGVGRTAGRHVLGGRALLRSAGCSHRRLLLSRPERLRRRRRGHRTRRGCQVRGGVDRRYRGSARFER